MDVYAGAFGLTMFNGRGGGVIACPFPLRIRTNARHRRDDAAFIRSFYRYTLRFSDRDVGGTKIEYFPLPGKLTFRERFQLHSSVAGLYNRHP